MWFWNQNSKALWFLILLICLIIPACGSEPRGVVITSTIKNSDDYNLVDAYIQLVPLDASGKLEVERAKVISDIHGNTVGIEYSSDFPTLKIATGGNFKYTLENLPPGRYILAAQRLHPKGVKRVDAILGHPTLSLGRPLATEDRKVIVIEISTQEKSSYIIKLGNIVIPFVESNKFIFLEFDNVTLIKP
jgi:hypothetical protein